MLKRKATLLIACGMLAGATAAAVDPQATNADVVLLNGKIVTVDRDFRLAQAIAIDGERILAIGSNPDIKALIGVKTRVIDLRGRSVIPGLVDSHLHAMFGAGNEFAVPMTGVRSISDIQKVIAQRVAQSAAGQWITASGDWHESQLSEGRLPTRYEIDAVSPDHPVAIPRGGHVVVANSRALALAGIDRTTADPGGGIIVRDRRSGEATGALVESATALVRRLLPALTPERRLQGLKLYQARLNAVGITGIVEPGLSREELSAYEALRSHDELTTRITALLWARNLSDVQKLTPAVATFAGDDWLAVQGFKTGIDGGVEGAYLHEPYRIVEGEQNQPQFYGKLLLPSGGGDELQGMFLHAARNKLQFQIHVVGDAAIDQLISVLGRTDRTVPLRDLRWAVVHAFLPSDAALKRIKDLGLYITVQDQPVSLGHNMIRYWGHERAARAIPIRKMLDAGIRVGGGTDAPVVNYNPFVSIGWMVTRRVLSENEALGPDQAIAREDALRIYTVGSAEVKSMEDRIGSLEVGKLADLVVLSEDILSVPAEQIAGITSLLTIVGGKVVYDRLQ